MKSVHLFSKPLATLLIPAVIFGTLAFAQSISATESDYDSEDSQMEEQASEDRDDMERQLESAVASLRQDLISAEEEYNRTWAVYFDAIIELSNMLSTIPSGTAGLVDELDSGELTRDDFVEILEHALSGFDDDSYQQAIRDKEEARLAMLDAQQRVTDLSHELNQAEAELTEFRNN